MNEKVNKLCLKLQSIPENQLTVNIIKPLFEKMNFHKVEFYGGTDEEGKDLLLWGKNNFSEITLSVAQVKHFKFSNKASGSNSLQTIINQLTTCLIKNVHYSDKSIHIPFEVILISSHIIDSKNIKSRFDLNPSLIDKKIRIIDGLKLAELLIKHIPNITSELINEEIDFSSFSSSMLNNQTLLKALNFNNQLAIEDINTDIDFSLGKYTTRLFFNYLFKGEKKGYNLDISKWNSFKNNISKLNTEMLSWLITPSVDLIEKKYIEDLNYSNKWDNEHKTNLADIINLKIELDKLAEKFKNDLELFYDSLEKLNNIQSNLALGSINLKDNFKKVLLNNEIKRHEKIIKPYLDLKLKIQEQEKKQEEHSKNKIDAKYNFIINGKLLSKWLLFEKDYIIKKINIFNDIQPSTEELQNYFNYCKKIIKLSKLLLTNKEILDSLNLDLSLVNRIDFESTRLKISINKVFDTGINVTLLGQAGSGKTTSLQMYAISRRNKSDKIIIWAPLSEVLRNWKSKKASQDYKIINLDIAICEYLQFNNVSIKESQFKNTLKTKKVAMLFDGLDEAIRLNEWLPNAIDYFSKKYAPKIQVIVSSRSSGPFAEELNFFNITLLPFTKDQRNQFLDKWFKKADSEIPQKIKNHLEKNKAIDEITRNPLLVTTICTLAKYELPLPQTEITLYNDRLKLLTGYYDNVKNIKTRITTSPQNLELLSKKIAYFLHSNYKRLETVEILEEIAILSMKNKLNKVQSKKALQELIDPCNVLVPMSETGSYGFGHLAYQEHLVAVELTSNRNIDIPILLDLRLEWWQQSLYYFAQMSDDLTWLIKSLNYEVHNDNYKKSLEELIKLRPDEEIERIQKLMIGYFNDDIYDL